MTLKPLTPPFRCHTDVARSAAFSPDGLHVVSAAMDGTVRLWLTVNGEPIWATKGPSPPVNSASFSPDGRRIVSASSDNTLRIWDVETGNLVKALGGKRDFRMDEPLRGRTRYLPSAAFSPDGRLIVYTSDDNTIMLWDWENTMPDGVPFRGHTGSLYGAAFSPDGRRIVSASADGTVRVWDVETGQQLGDPIYSLNATSVAFSPTEWSIMSGSTDGTILRWDVSAYALGLDEAAGKADRLCPMDNAELSSHGIFDGRFPEQSQPEMTDAQRTACGEHPR
jgi:WD40 repeat protein